MNKPHNSDDIRFTRWLFRCFLVLLFLAPLPLGSNRPFFWSLLVAAAALIALIWAAGWLLGMARWPHNLRHARWPLLMLLLFLGWSALQMAPSAWIPSFVIPDFITGAFEHVNAQARLSLDVHASSDSLLLSIGLVLMALLTLLLARSSRRVLQVLFVLVIAGLLQALYGSLMMLSGAEYGFFEPKEFGRGVATGTFINRNHYANLLVLSLSAGTGLLLAQMNLRGADNLRARVRGFLQAALGPKARLRIYMVIMVIALVLTRSRMGNSAFFAALTLVGFFALWRLRAPSRPLLVLMVSVLVIDILMVGTWFGVEQVVDRIQRSVQVEEEQWVMRDTNRRNANRESMEIIALAPLTGVGGGSFYTVYPAWRGDDQGFMDHTHNDFLEFTIGYGLLGAALLGCFIVLCMQRAAQGLRDRDQPRRFGVSFAALMAMVAMLIHSTVDFSLHIPANAAWFIVLCMLPWCMRNSHRHRG